MPEADVSRETEGRSFGPYRFDPESLTLWKERELVPLQKLPARVLSELLAEPGSVVLRETLYDRFWPASRAGCEDRLNTAIAQIRTALGDSARSPVFIATVPRRGYRFIHPVGPEPESSARGVSETPRPRLLVGWAAVAVLALALGSTLAPVSEGLPEPEDPTVRTAERPASGSAAAELHYRARLLARSGRLTDLIEALGLLDQSLSLEPEDAAAQATYATVASMVAFFRTDPELMERARAAAAAASRIDPSAPSARTARGMVHLYGERQFDSAIRELESVIEGDDTSPLVTLALADAHRRAGHWRTSEELYDRLLASDPYRTDALADLAFNQERSRRWSEADGTYVQAMALEPRRTELAIGRALVRARAGDPPEAVLDALTRSYEMGGVPPRYALLFSGELTRYVGPLVDWKAADPALVDEESRQGFDLNRGWLMLRARETSEGRRVLRRVVAALPSDLDDPALWSGIPFAPAHLGLAYALLGDRESAVRIVDEILRRFPAERDAITSAFLRTRAAEILAQVGEKDRSVALLEDLLRRPAPLSREWLALDPIWRPLDGHPAFERLLNRRAGDFMQALGTY